MAGKKNWRTSVMMGAGLAVLIGLSFGLRQRVTTSSSTESKVRFNVLALYENGGHHVLYSAAARKWLDRLSVDSNFHIDYIQHADTISRDLLSHYQLFIQLDYPPYGWGERAMEAFKEYMEEAKGGWIGFHHAALLGEFDGYGMWKWYDDWMGGIKFKNYIADFAAADVIVEDSMHPCMKGLPAKFKIAREEWYTWDKSPRAGVRVLASVDEGSYSPDRDIKMGDHPVVWTTEKLKARNVYIFMGHGPELFENAVYTKLFRNAIFWASGR